LFGKESDANFGHRVAVAVDQLAGDGASVRERGQRRGLVGCPLLAYRPARPLKGEQRFDADRVDFVNDAKAVPSLKGVPSRER
jgi:hypothetical protein